MDGDFINAKNKLIYITFSNVFHMAPTAFEGRRPEYSQVGVYPFLDVFPLSFIGRITTLHLLPLNDGRALLCVHMMDG